MTKQGKQKVEVTLGDKTIEKEFDIKYLDGVKDRMGVTVNGCLIISIKKMVNLAILRI